jgi:hypothetical protein
MKVLIVLPHWYQDEIHQYEWMMDRWAVLTKTDHEYEFLLASRHDFEGDLTRLTELCSKYAPTTTLKLKGSFTSHPLACNEMWWHCMNTIEEAKECNHSLVYWWECDVMPQNSNWLNYCMDVWNDKYLILGHMVTEEWINETNPTCQDKTPHINGAAFYNQRLTNLVTLDQLSNGPWDVELAKLFTFDTTQFDSLYGCELYDIKLNPLQQGSRFPDRLMVHGAKSMSSKEEIFSRSHSTAHKICTHCQGKGWI